MSGFLGILEISATGLQAERLRMEVAAANIANAMSVSGSAEGGYRPLRVVTQAATAFESVMSDAGAMTRGVTAEVMVGGRAAQPVHDPEHPLADAQGFVYRPAVDAATEMTDIMRAVRAYEANVKAAAASRQMLQRALEIGAGS